MSFYKVKWLEQFPKEFKPVFYKRYVNNIFVLFESVKHLWKFRHYFNTCHRNMFFSFEQEKNGKLSFLDIEVSREKKQFVTTVYRKPTFSSVYTYCESFLPTIYKFGIYSCLSLFQNFVLTGESFITNLGFQNNFFKKNWYALPFIDNCFKTFVDKLFIKYLQLTTVEKKAFFSSLP